MRERNIVLWYVVSILTFGIGLIVWYYLLNKDAKTLARNKSWSPALSVFAITIGSILVIPAYVSNWRTWNRVREATDADGLSAGLQFCLVFIPIVNLAFWGYLQSKLNRSVSVSGVAAAASVA
jgi:uncharacterized membrane protein